MSANVRHSSESAEWYSPEAVVEAARALMGGIDLDPFSSDEAQEVVRAHEHWTLEDARLDGQNGFTDGWALPPGGTTRVFLNPPGGTVDDAGYPIVGARPGQPKCEASGSCGFPAPHSHVGRHSAQKRAWRKCAEEWRSGRVSQAVFLCFSLELLQTSQSGAEAGVLFPHDFPTCFPSRRLPYRRPGGQVGAQPPHASCVVYLPPVVDSFRRGWSGCLGGDWGFSQDLKRFRSLFSPLGRVVVPL